MKILLFLTLLFVWGVEVKQYKPKWSDLDTRPLPRWYDQAKVGILVNWGVYSVPSCCGATQWFWANWKHGNEDIVNFMKVNYPRGFTYNNFASEFTAEFFKPHNWAKLFKNSGARYVILTSKSYDGYALFPSRQQTNWDSVDTGPHRDLVRYLANAIRKNDMAFGVYYSLIETYNPTYMKDSENNFTTYDYRDQKMWPDILQLVYEYEPSIIWADGHWDADDKYFDSTSLLAWLYNKSPVKDNVVVNDRWGTNTPCKHGDFFNCMNGYSPEKLQKHKWESIISLDKVSWGHRRDLELFDVLTIQQLLKKMVTAVSCGGNILIGVGATKEGTIPLIFQERLLLLGHWLSINGEAIYGSSPWKVQQDSNDKNVWYTCTRDQYNGSNPTGVPTNNDKLLAIYAIILVWPQNDTIKLTDIVSDFYGKDAHVEMLGYESALNWTVTPGREFVLYLPPKLKGRSRYAWTLKFTRQLI